MALDNAQFISELSITDPPGTDPLSEGDDQIRTAKRAVFQSFPFVDKQVDLTADNLNDAALQAQQNNFTARNTFSNVLTDWDAGAGSDVGFRFLQAGARDWQMTVEGASRNFVLDRFVAGIGQGIVLTWDNATGQATFANRTHFDAGTRVSNGTNSVPSYSFTSDTTTGMRLVNPGILSFSVTGLGQLSLTTSAATFVVSLLGRDASITNPTYAFDNEIGLGLFRSAAGTMSFVSTGTVRMAINTKGVNMANLQTGPAGLSAGDLYKSDTASGFIAIVL